ncbi:hypothetical protein LF41_779 [Lysobacter dokdonensis DS-58]|uniref:Uncharacterized protein n=2 Tax=Noviluteimonas TaxID=3382693 RepID=A0A0A2WKB4_9GAMM|nr:hypothetical protein LF41_779 [Lysobacter dokdonensis DS-58]
MLWATALLLVVSIQLNKFYYLYFAAFFCALWFVIRRGRMPRVNLSSTARSAPLLLALTVVFAGAVFFLYRFQYQAGLNEGLVDVVQLRETLIYRVFFASSDALRLWIDYFHFGNGPVGVSAVSKLCEIWSDQCVNSNTLIPEMYVGKQLTTMQVGFLGTAIATVGLAGVPIASIVVVLIIAINGAVQRTYATTVLSLSLAIHLFLNAFFLTTREMHTAMLSGGALSLPLLYWGWNKFVAKPARNREAMNHG